MKAKDNSVKIVPAVCTNCSANLNVDSSIEKAFCQYCGTQFVVSNAINNYNVNHATIEHVNSFNVVKNNVVDSVFSFVKHQQDRIETKKREEEERIRREEQERRENNRKMINNTFVVLKKYWWLAIIIALIIFGLVALLFNMSNSDDSSELPTNEISVGHSYSEFEGENYMNVVTLLEGSGFTNIETIAQRDLVVGWLTEDGEVKEVAINGYTDFSSYDKFENDAKVVVTYHTFPENVEDVVTNDEQTENSIVQEEPLEQEIIIEPLTIDNNQDMVKLFSIPDFDPYIAEFAEKYKGKTIEFDGNIAYLVNLDSYETVVNYDNIDEKFDVLMYTGNYGEYDIGDKSFKFENIYIADLNLVGENIPEFIQIGQNLKVIGKIVSYNEIGGLFYLEPVSIEIR